MEPSNLWVDMMYSIVEFKMGVLEELLRLLSQNSRIFVTVTSLENTIINSFCYN